MLGRAYPVEHPGTNLVDMCDNALRRRMVFRLMWHHVIVGVKLCKSPYDGLYGGSRHGQEIT